MTIVAHELRRGRASWFLWTGTIGFLLVLCIFLFPEMKGEMAGVNDLFSSMGSFTAAFGMDRLDFGTLSGFYAIECGNILGLGGAFYAALCAIGILCKEERERTAEFLLSHPVSRRRVVSEKLLAALLQILAMNLLLYALSASAIAAIREPVPWQDLSLLHLAFCLLHLELGCLCFGLSAFLRKGSLGAGLGLAAVLYFLHLIANITETAAFLDYVTPFAYCEGADILTSGSLDGTLLAIGSLFALLGLLAAYGKYTRKDIC